MAGTKREIHRAPGNGVASQPDWFRALTSYTMRAILHNLREDGDEIWTRLMAAKEGTLWYYRSLVIALRRHGANALIDELDRVVTEIEKLAGAV